MEAYFIDTMDSQLIISIKDFRNLTGIDTAQFTDSEVVEIIKQLDFLAEMYIKQAIAGEDVADKLENKK